MLESWFFACVPGSTFMRDWCDEFVRTNEFNTTLDYLRDVLSKGTHFNNMKGLGCGPDYLTIHVSAQKVFQEHRLDANRYSMCLFSACAGPYAYLHVNGWDSELAVAGLVDERTRIAYQKFPFNKLRSCERKTLEQYNESLQLLAFSR
jgi:hypothetical protein